MRILLVSGSLRTGSWTTALLHAAAACLPADVTTTVGQIAALPAYNEDLDQADPPAEVTRWREAVSAADALIVATPEYNGAVPGCLKNALDWASRPRGAAGLTDKPVALLSASPSPYGGAWARENLNRVLEVAGARPLPSSVGVGQVHQVLVDGQITDPAVQAEVAALVTHLVESVEAPPA